MLAELAAGAFLLFSCGDEHPAWTIDKRCPIMPNLHVIVDVTYELELLMAMARLQWLGTPPVATPKAHRAWR